MSACAGIGEDVKLWKRTTSFGSTHLFVDVRISFPIPLASCLYLTLQDSFIESGWLVSFSLSALAPSTELPCWNIQVRGFCPVAFLARRVGDRWGGFSFCGCLAAL